MKFRGLDPRTRWLRWGLLAIALGVVLGTTAPKAIGALSITWEANRSILPWVFERLFAFLAYGAVTGSVVYGLLLSTKILDVIAHRPITFALHQDLASAGLGLAAVHGMLLGLDKTVPFTLAQIAVPGMAPHAPAWVAVGQVAFYLMAIVIGSFYLRRRIGQRSWRTLHYVTFLAFLGATVHGVMAGTDSGRSWAWWIYVGATIIVVFLLTYRIALSAGASQTTVPVGGPRSAGIPRDTAAAGPSAEFVAQDGPTA